MSLAYIKMLDGPDDVDPDYGVEGRPGYGGGHPSHPITLPPLPGIWPPPGEISHPIVIPPPGHITGWPIFIQGKPDNPIALPPGIWPPLPPSTGIAGKVAIVIWVVGVGYRWLIYEAPPVTGAPEPK